MKVELLYGPILQSWLELLKWHEEKHSNDIETIKTVKHMICVYAMEGVEALYQEGYSESEAETIIDKSFCRDYLDNYKNIVLSENRLKQIGDYYDHRKEFISRQRKMGRKARFKNRLKAFWIFRTLKYKKKYKEVLDKEFYEY